MNWPRLARERAFWGELLARTDRKAATVLLLTTVFVVMQMVWGTMPDGLRPLARGLDEPWRELSSWAWWFGFQFITGFLLPVLVLKWAFGETWGDMGLGRGDVRLAGWALLFYTPGVVVVTWFLSDQAAFQAQYPHFRGGIQHDGAFWLYHGLFTMYWMGWEYLWRGFVLFGTRHVLGPLAILVQAMPFAIMHFGKPAPELMLSVVGGIALGALVWRLRSFWIAVPLHAIQMLILDLFCRWRQQSGVSGTGLEALQQLF